VNPKRRPCVRTPGPGTTPGRQGASSDQSFGQYDAHTAGWMKRARWDTHPRNQHCAARGGSRGRPTGILSRPVISASELTLVKSVKPVYPLRAERPKRKAGWSSIHRYRERRRQERNRARASPGRRVRTAGHRRILAWRYRPVLEEGRPPRGAAASTRFALTG